MQIGEKSSDEKQPKFEAKHWRAIKFYIELKRIKFEVNFHFSFESFGRFFAAVSRRRPTSPSSWIYCATFKTISNWKFLCICWVNRCRFPSAKLAIHEVYGAGKFSVCYHKQRLQVDLERLHCKQITERRSKQIFEDFRHFLQCVYTQQVFVDLRSEFGQRSDWKPKRLRPTSSRDRICKYLHHLSTASAQVPAMHVAPTRDHAHEDLTLSWRQAQLNICATN